jgi:nitrogenase molybdenum-cofactor synthesis protein NifE
MEPVIETFESRKKHMCVKGEGLSIPVCDKASLPGTVTQRTCVFGGARIVLMPITDSSTGTRPIGCAACTWDIREVNRLEKNFTKKDAPQTCRKKTLSLG